MARSHLSNFPNIDDVCKPTYVPCFLILFRMHVAVYTILAD
jgi:hypothetical protein